MRLNVEGEGPAEPFLGRMTLRGRKAEFQQGTGPNEFQNPSGIACDARGRVYVADAFNNRVQVFSAEGRHLLTIPADRPRLVCVHAKTGGIYVQHQGRVGGRSVQRLTKFSSFDNPREEFHVDGIYTAVMAVDSWAPKPRVWVAGGVSRMGVTTTSSYYDRAGPSVTVWEEDGGALRKIVDFDEEMEALGGTDYFGRWEGSCYDKVVCDPVRETLWWTWEKNQATRIVFDLKTGRLLGQYSLYGGTDDIAFDKRGYLHAHFNPGFYMRGVGRLDPDSAEPYRGMGKFRLPHSRVFTMKEVPYDYGVFSEHPQRRTWTGILPVKDQPGAKFFQDGFGVTMRGEVAEQCNIYYVPKMEAEGWAAADAGRAMRDRLGQGSGPERYSEFLRSIQEAEKRGEQTYFIRRQPGIPLAGGTIWTFEASGELREEAAVIARKLVIGSMMDEDGCLYFANDGAKLVGGKPFLHQRGGNLGAEEPLDRYNRTPVTYTYMKTRPNGVRWLLKNAAVGLDPLPDRPADVVSYGPFGPAQMGSGESWIEGAEWMYAGYSPAVPAGCTCPSTRAHLDWFKRSYVPEAYRRSIGVLDTAGNVILRFGRYGNHDDALAMKPGGEEIALTLPRFISGTDTYLCFDDWGERLVVLKLAYHAEAAAPVPAK
ncbi:MAG: hypothetical protein JXR37_07580 [Kiritimatiellae bacterium]|nr:hypothetical protein [Kiritimatiellia bacterium]